MKPITVSAFAKINLSLRVKAKRPDGFHEVQTILHSIDLADRLRCEGRRGPFVIRCALPGIPTDRTNLVWRAAQALWDAAGRTGAPRDAMITIEKRIPMQAGLGGGSSDAAATLLALRQVWHVQVPDGSVLEIAAKLGSDVPFFLVGGAALGLGRGEEVYPLAGLPPAWAVLVFPPFGVATADAFAWLDAWRAGTSAASPPRWLPGTWLGTSVPLVNDLEPPVIERHPVIGKLIERLTKMGADMAAMSGSGSTVFGVFRTAAAAEKALALLRKTGANARLVRLRNRAA